LPSGVIGTISPKPVRVGIVSCIKQFNKSCIDLDNAPC
jgi:hypothetical protein